MTVEASERDPHKVCDVSECNAWKQGDFDYCRNHKGVNDDGSSHKGNKNGVDHGLYAESNFYYQEAMDETQRALCDQIFQDYCTAFRERNGELHTGDETQLFEVAVNHIKVIDADKWLVAKPDELESTHPLVDKEEKYNTEGVPYQEYQPSTLLNAQQKLSNHNRRWLKDKNLLHDPESRKADEMGSLAAVIEHNNQN